MDKIIPNELTDVEKEIKKTKKQFNRAKQLENLANIVLIIVGITATIVLWTVFNQSMSKQAYENGYNRGFDACIEENNLYDKYDSAYIPTTDAEIWETYHDCNMYGLPEYARQFCEAKES